MKAADIILNEWRAILKDRTLLAVLLLVPIGYMLLFGSLYSQNKVREMPLVLVDEDHSQLSQQIIQAFEQSESFHIAEQTDSEQLMLDRIEKGKAQVGLIIPSGLSKEIKQGKQAEIMTVIDGSNMIIANSAVRSANDIVQTFSGGISIKRLEANGLSSANAFSIRFGYRLLFNPGLDYSIFLLLGLFGAVLQQVIFLGVALCVTREKEQGTWPSYLALWKQPWKVIYGKLAPYFLIGVLISIITSGVLYRIFHVPFLGGSGLLFLLFVVFVLGLLGIGLFASLFAKSQLQATQVTMLIAVPSFLLSGFTWPFQAMPEWVAALGHALPLTYFLHGVREIAIKGNGWDQIAGDISVLLAMAGGTLILSAIAISIKGRKQAAMQSADVPLVPSKQIPLA